MNTEHLVLADKNHLSAALAAGPLLDYSVGLCRVREENFTFLGSGVLIKKQGHYGVLTARHCLHACMPEVRLGLTGSDKLYLILRRGDAVLVEPAEALERVLVTPKSEEFGPDLTFIEILEVQRRASLKAIGSFWSLDRSRSEISKAFGGVGSTIVSVGFPERLNTQCIGGSTIRLTTNAMQLGPNTIGNRDISEKDGWDYVESHFNDNKWSGIPPSFKGFSGGPVWGVKLVSHKADGHVSVENHALVGINFYEIVGQNDERRMRAHFVKSIYELAWTSLI